MDDVVLVDGSAGEGGGQVLRTALSLSLMTGRPLRIDRIRAGRRKPGLMRQHLTSVQAAARIGAAIVEGAQLGSTELTFHPSAIRPGEHEFSTGSAGSATLVLQTILPALLTAPQSSRIRVEGGTHNPWAPPFDFLARVFLPVVERMGPRFEATLVRPGFYPRGGGDCEIVVHPAALLTPLELPARGVLRHRRARAVVAHLPRRIAERELQVVCVRLGWAASEVEIVEATDAFGPGNVLSLELVFEHVTEMVTAFGERGKRAEAVAEEGVDQLRRYTESDAPVGEHLADQLLLPLAVAGAGSFVATTLSLHATTNMEVIAKFLPVRFETTRLADAAWRVTVKAQQQSS
jgi:RNA 3'-terminal phosphate cyclase (ATP)